MHPSRCGATRRGRWCRRTADARAETPPPLPPERPPAGSRGVLAGSPIPARGRCPFCSRPLAQSTVTVERGEFVEAADGATVDHDHDSDRRLTSITVSTGRSREAETRHVLSACGVPKL